MIMLASVIASITSCSNNKSNKEENGMDSIAIAQAKADSIAKANNLVVGMKVSEALQKPGVKKACIDGFDGLHEGEKLILIQNGKKFLTNIGYTIRTGEPLCSNLKFDVMPDSYEQDLTLVRAKDCTASAKIIKELKK